jgi:putative ATPase
MEDGTITLVGATTENPSFELNAALLSRARVLTFRSLDEEAIASCSPRRGDRGQGAAARRRGPRGARAHGRRRRALPALTLAEEAWRAAGPARSSTPQSCRRSSSAARRSTTRARRGTTTSSARCTRRARLRSRCGALLSRAHARRRRGPAFSRRAAWCAWRWRISGWPIRRRSCRQRGQGRLRLLGSPEGELALAQARLSRDRAEIERRSMSPSRRRCAPPRSTAR